MIIIQRFKMLLSDKTGDLLYFDSVWKIMLCVIIGALLFAGSYYLFDKVVMPHIYDWTNRWFDWAQNEEIAHLNQLYIGGKSI